MSARGFTLVELLIALLVLLAISAAVWMLMSSVRDAFERSVSAGDAAARSRSAIELLTSDLRQAGTGLTDVAAVAVPHASLDLLDAVAPFTALSVLRTTQNAAQGVLRDAAPDGASTLQLESAFACAGTNPACGFLPGTGSAIFDAARLERIGVESVFESMSVLQLAAPMSASFPVGAHVAALQTTTYGTRADTNGVRLVRLTSGGAEQTLIDHLVKLEFTLYGVSAPPVPAAQEDAPPSYGPQPPPIAEDDDRDDWPAGENCTMRIDGAGRRSPRLPALDGAASPINLNVVSFSDGPWCPDGASVSRFDADLLRVRAIGVSIIVEVPSAQLRGPASQLFGRAGTGTRATQWVPDLELHAVVMLRSRR